MKRICNICYLLIIVPAIFLVAAKETKINLSASDVKIRATPPGSTVTAAYLKIKNPTKNNDALIAAASEIAKSIEIHYTQMVDGIMDMQQQEALPIKAGETAILKPRSWHLMVMGLKRPLKIGERVPITLTFKSGKRLEVGAEVIDPRVQR